MDSPNVSLVRAPPEPFTLYASQTIGLPLQIFARQLPRVDTVEEEAVAVETHRHSECWYSAVQSERPAAGKGEHAELDTFMFARDVLWKGARGYIS